MIHEVDEVLRKLLMREIPIKNGEVDIVFDLPKREWSSRLNRPTLNLFLYDLRENPDLRAPQWQQERNGNGEVTKKRSPARVDLSYMLTAWAAEPEDEHNMLTRSLIALYRFPFLPDELLPEVFENQPSPIPLRVAEHDRLRTPADYWSALDNELRPAVSLGLTLALDPYQSFTGPIVRTRELRFGTANELPINEQLDEDVEADTFYMVGGEVAGAEKLNEVRLTLLEKGKLLKLNEKGQFIAGNLQAGEYTLELAAKGRKPSRHTLTVPSEDYDFKA